MATITARKVDDRDYVTLSETAGLNGRSISEELRLIIAEHARKQRAKKLVGDMVEFLGRDPLKLPGDMTSLDLLHQERGSW